MRLHTFLLVACSATLSFGQVTQEPAGKTPATVTAFTQAIDLRRELVAAIIAGKQTPAQAFSLLQTAKLPAGYDFGPDAGLAIAAADIGQRLIASGKSAEAEMFFNEAEKSLGTAIEKTKDTDAKGKAELFEQRAFLRATFLNKAPGADADLAEAVKLQPEDKRLQQKRDLLPAAKTGRKSDQPKG